MKEIIINYNGEQIKIILIRKKVKNINLRIKNSGEVIVTANDRISEERIINFINSKLVFIKKHLDKFKNIREQLVEEHIKNDKNHIKYLGKIYNVEFITKKSKACDYKIFEDIIYIPIKDINNDEEKEKAINKWYSSRCVEIFTKAYNEVHKLFANYNIPFVEIKVRKMKSRWGSCMPIKKRVTLNSELIKTPYECIEFVIAHELAHLVEPNHSRKFYNVLSSVMLDWKDRKSIIDKVYLT
ncbi:MAG: SprT family zinc-dependent metalloprotease [Clostridium sp.]|uniref:M48 family metallopeptidase n=1 Tax=Clostridium sp. TaxID=1506 RepID=UPI002FC635AD